MFLFAKEGIADGVVELRNGKTSSQCHQVYIPTLTAVRLCRPRPCYQHQLCCSCSTCWHSLGLVSLWRWEVAPGDVEATPAAMMPWRKEIEDTRYAQQENARQDKIPVQEDVCACSGPGTMRGPVMVSDGLWSQQEAQRRGAKLGLFWRNSTDPQRRTVANVWSFGGNWNMYVCTECVVCTVRSSMYVRRGWEDWCVDGSTSWGGGCGPGRVLGALGGGPGVVPSRLPSSSRLVLRSSTYSVLVWCWSQQSEGKGDRSIEGVERRATGGDWGLGPGTWDLRRLATTRVQEHQMLAQGTRAWGAASD